MTDLASRYRFERATPAEEPNHTIEPPKPTANATIPNRSRPVSRRAPSAGCYQRRLTEVRGQTRSAMKQLAAVRQASWRQSLPARPERSRLMSPFGTLRRQRVGLRRCLLAQEFSIGWRSWRILRPPCPHSQPEDRRLQALACRLARHDEQVLRDLGRGLYAAKLDPLGVVQAQRLGVDTDQAASVDACSIILATLPANAS